MKAKFKVGDEIIDDYMPELGSAKILAINDGWLTLYWSGTSKETAGSGSRSEDNENIRKLSKLERTLK